MLGILFDNRRDCLAAPGTSIAPVNLLLFGENGFNIFDQLKKPSLVVQAAIGAGTIHVEPLFALHAFRSSPICGPGLAVARDALPAFRKSNQCSKASRKCGHPRRRREHLEKRGRCSRCDDHEGEKLTPILMGRGSLSVPFPLVLEVLRKIPASSRCTTAQRIHHGAALPQKRIAVECCELESMSHRGNQESCPWAGAILFNV